jgi:hypothetical protein
MTKEVQANLIILMLNDKVFQRRDCGLCIVHLFQLCFVC